VKLVKDENERERERVLFSLFFTSFVLNLMEMILKLEMYPKKFMSLEVIKSLKVSQEEVQGINHFDNRKLKIYICRQLKENFKTIWTMYVSPTDLMSHHYITTSQTSETNGEKFMY